MYPTWTKSKAKELTRLGEKHGKTLLNIIKCPNDDAIEHPSKKAASTSLKSQDKACPQGPYTKRTRWLLS